MSLRFMTFTSGDFDDSESALAWVIRTWDKHFTGASDRKMEIEENTHRDAEGEVTGSCFVAVVAGVFVEDDENE